MGRPVDFVAVAWACTDVLFGRQKLKQAKTEQLFALSTAQVTLEVELGLRRAARRGVVFKPLSAGEFVRAENELRSCSTVAARDSGSRIERKEDELGFDWIVVRDNDFEDLVTTVHLDRLGAAGARLRRPQLLAAVFRFEGGRSIPST